MKRLLAASITLVVLGTATVSLAADEDPVITGSTDQFMPSAELDDWIGWSELREDRSRFDARIRMQDGTHNRALHRRSGSHSFTGGFARGKVVFQDAKGSSSDLFLYTLATGAYSAPPAGVNTDLWEWGADISNRFILFGRNKFLRNVSPWKVILYDRQARTFRTLDQTTNACACIFPEFVNDRYAVWSKCPNVCNVFVFDSETRTTTRVPNPGPIFNYNGSVTEDGEVYFLRAGLNCGQNVAVTRWTLGEPASDFEAIHAFPAGFDGVLRTYVVEGEDGHDDLYFDRANCDDNRYRGNIYVIRDVDLATPVAPVAPRTTGSGRRTVPVPPGAIPLG